MNDTIGQKERNEKERQQQYSTNHKKKKKERKTREKNTIATIRGGIVQRRNMMHALHIANISAGVRVARTNS
jgi:hypothetical protein